ncbi:hypothetical protein MYXO_00245 [Myxococcaceae bacterium]|nr:hypothetical protein MYXO_00245 [Myxococcaceae bacterium]
MRGVAEAAPSASLRARRWDVVILGASLPGLVAAARFGLDGLRVLVVEEEAATRRFAGLREPFLIPGNANGGVLDACMKAITVPLIERRKLEPEAISLQVVLPEVRLDIGDSALTMEELVAWGLAKPEEANALVKGIQAAGLAEREAMLEAGIVRGAAPRSAPRAPGAVRLTKHGRGLPEEVAKPSPRLAPVLDAQVRALSNLAAAPVPPEARGRLLGSALEGAWSHRTAEGFLRGCLRRRIQSLFGEFRTLAGRFDLVSVGNHPGISLPGGNDVWIGRALVVNAPRGRLGAALRELGSDPSDLLDAPPPTRRRVVVHLRVRRSVLPEAMASRVVWLRDPSKPADGTNLICLSLFPAPQAGSDRIELVASAIVPEADAAADAAAIEAEIEAAARSLMPFSEGAVSREAVPPVRWDDDDALCDPRMGEGWPVEAEVRLSTKPPVYALPREAVGALGVEGDLLLGWRAAELVRSELA